MQIVNEWIRYEEQPNEERDVPWEYELRSRVHLIGTIDVGWGLFRFLEVPEHTSTEARSSVLRLHFRPQETANLLNLPARQDQHYHPKGSAGEFECLLTLFTRVHFVLTRGTYTGAMPMLNRFTTSDHIAHGDYDGENIKLDNIQILFDHLKAARRYEMKEVNQSKRSSRFVNSLIMASRFYHLAYSQLEIDETLAYVCLVSALECMLSHYSTEIALHDINEEAAKLIEESVSDEIQKAAIEEALLKHKPAIRTRLTKFVTAHVTDAFWNDSTRPPTPHRFRDISDIQAYTKRVYDARSRAVHAGEPFPPCGHRNEEHTSAHSMSVGGTKQWKARELVPSVRAFERLTHHVLTEALRRWAGVLMSTEAL